MLGFDENIMLTREMMMGVSANGDPKISYRRLVLMKKG